MQRFGSTGAKRLVVMTFHGDPLHNIALDAAVQDAQARGIQAIAPFSALLHKILAYQSGEFDHCLQSIADPKTREYLSDHMVSDFHAGFFETSLMLHFWPEHVSPNYQKLAPCPEYKPSSAFLTLAKYFPRSRLSTTRRRIEFHCRRRPLDEIKKSPGIYGHTAPRECGMRKCVYG